MTKTANKFNSLAQIKFVEDIDQETAANYSGGIDIALYSDSNFQGQNQTISSQIGGGGNLPGFFNDKTSSIWIFQGVWEFYSEGNNRGDVLVLGPGKYDVIDPYLNDRISSCRRVA